jgi:hypothetical protein
MDNIHNCDCVIVFVTYVLICRRHFVFTYHWQSSHYVVCKIGPVILLEEATISIVSRECDLRICTPHGPGLLPDPPQTSAKD